VRQIGAESAGVVPAVELAPGYTIAPVITGCWQLAADHGAASASFEQLCERWRRGLDLGYTTFDCADIYTGVETLLGRFLARLEAPHRVQIHTKYVPDKADLATLRRRDVESAIDRSLERLGRDTLDLLQFHWWNYTVPGAIEVAGWLDELRREGKIRHLGLTNFDLEHTREISAAGVALTSVQIQYSVLDRRPERGLGRWCAENGVGLLCYGTLAGGMLSERYLGVAGAAPNGNRSLTKYRLIVEEYGGWPALQETLAALERIAQRHGTTVGQVALRWVLDRLGVKAVIVGAGRSDRSREMLALWAEDWNAEDWAELTSILARRPGVAGAVYGLERDPATPHFAILRTDLNAS